MLDFPLMLWVKLPVVNRIQPQSNKFATGVENEATGDAKLNDSPDHSGLEILLVIFVYLSFKKMRDERELQ